MRASGSLLQRRSLQGFSLIELLISMALGLAVLAGLFSVYLVIKQSFRYQETTGRLQEDGTFALDSIANGLRMAGYSGCTGIDRTGTGAATNYYPGSVIKPGNSNRADSSNPLAVVEPTNPAVTQQPFTSFNFIRGFDNVPNSMFAGSPPSTGTTDSLFFAGGSSNVVAVSAPMAAANSPLTLAADTYHWGAATANRKFYDFIVSNCNSSSIFKGIVKVSGGNPSTVSIGHDPATDTPAPPPETDPPTPPTPAGDNADNSSSSFATSAIFGTDAVVMPAEWNFYYVATRAGANTPSLYRVFFDGNERQNAEEIVSNVESMHLNYGENTTLDTQGQPTFVADVWRTCATGPASATCDPVVDWSRVVAVRVGLMMISFEDNANPEVPVTGPTLLGRPYTPPAGAANRLRKEFSTTVILRNRVTAR